MPALPGPHLVFVHAHLAFASFEARFNARASLDHPCQFPKRRLRERSRTPSGRREVVMVAVALVLLGGIPRGTGLPCPVVREGPPGGIKSCRDTRLRNTTLPVSSMPTA